MQGKNLLQMLLSLKPNLLVALQRWVLVCHEKFFPLSILRVFGLGSMAAQQGAPGVPTMGAATLKSVPAVSQGLWR